MTLKIKFTEWYLFAVAVYLVTLITALMLLTINSDLSRLSSIILLLKYFSIISTAVWRYFSYESAFQYKGQS